VSYALSKLQDLAVQREEWKEQAMHWAKVALGEGGTKVRIAEILDISRPTLDKWLHDTSGEPRVLAIDLSPEQMRRLEQAAAYAGVSVEEFAHAAVMRRAREVLAVAEQDRLVPSW
jgi:predicted transcriptional regulator